MLDDMAIELHKNAVEKGFWGSPEDHDAINDIFIAKQCMMIVSEVIIRTLDLYAGMVEAGYTRLSLDQALKEKVDFNKTRPEKHGVRF